jgi:putative ABC transport system permease protein
MIRQKPMGLQQPLGTTVTWDKKYTVIGVVENIVMTSPYEPVKPAMQVQVLWVQSPTNFIAKASCFISNISHIINIIILLRVYNAKTPA